MNFEKIIGKDAILAFFEKQGIGYLPRSRTEWKPLLKMNLKRSPYYRANRKEFRELDRKYGLQIEKSIIAPVYIQKINEKIGYGLFAESEIAEGDFIGEYTGVVKEAEKITESFGEGSWETDFSWDYPDETGETVLEINGRLEGNELRFVNHGQICNVDVEHTLHKGQWVIFFVANRLIRAGEQLFVSYGEEYWNGGFRQLAELGEEDR